MKTIFIWLMSLLSLSTFAQQKEMKTTSFKVSGNCGECKERIENAADIKGVKVCTWNKDTKIAKITYDSTKVTLEEIQKAIVAAGHDIGPMKSDDKAYAKLPKCCKYRTGVCEEPKK